MYVWHETPESLETEHLYVENKYHSLEFFCQECDQNDCSNVVHFSSAEDSFSEFERESTENSTCLHFEHRGLHVANINICDIKAKLDEIKFLLNSASKLDIRSKCETVLDESTDDNILQMESFNFERKDRATLRQGTLNTKRGGGVVVYLADHIKYKRRNDFESSEIESIWLEINLKTLNLVL